MKSTASLMFSAIMIAAAARHAIRLAAHQGPATASVGRRTKLIVALINSVSGHYFGG
jgi:hypothetical protein